MLLSKRKPLCYARYACYAWKSGREGGRIFLAGIGGLLGGLYVLCLIFFFLLVYQREIYHSLYWNDDL